MGDVPLTSRFTSGIESAVSKVRAPKARGLQDGFPKIRGLELSLVEASPVRSAPRKLVPSQVASCVIQRNKPGECPCPDTDR